MEKKLTVTQGGTTSIYGESRGCVEYYHGNICLYLLPNQLTLCTRHTLPHWTCQLAWYPLRLDPWQLSLKYSNSATELLSGSGA